MKKCSGIKSAVIAMMAAGILCGCGNNDKTQTREADPSVISEPSVIAEPSVPTEPSLHAEPSASEETQGEQEEQKEGDIITEDIENVSLRFYVDYNISTGDLVSDVIPCQTVDVTGEELEKLKEMLPELTTFKPDPDVGEVFLTDWYELKINDDLIIDIGRDYGYCISKGEMFQLPAGLFDTIDGIAQDYCDNELYKTFVSKPITVLDSQRGREHTISDPEQIKNILAIKYYVINGNEEMMEQNDLAYVVDFENGDSLWVYYAGVNGFIVHPNGTMEYVHIKGMEDYLDQIITY